MVKQKNELRVGIVSSLVPASINSEKNQYIQNIDVELASYFAKQLGITLNIIVKNTSDELFDALQKNNIDIAASGHQLLCIGQNFQPSMPYYTLRQQLIYKNKIYRKQSITKINTPIVIAENSVQSNYLDEWKTQYPSLIWKVIPNTTPEELIRRVSTGEFSYTIADSRTISQMRRIYPSLTIIDNMTEPQSISWCLNAAQDNTLLHATNRFINYAMGGGIVDKLIAKYFDHINDFDYVDTTSFLLAIKNKLPKYEALFKKYAKTNNLDWHIVAAIAYQESHWNPLATSPTGVKGIMMLTQDTAKQLNIADRTDPEQSIQGGTTYLRQLLNRLPKSIPNDERILFALAAYNMGLGHVYDLRKLTEKKGGDKNSWSDAKKHLPLLQQKEYVNILKHGQAQGRQAYNFVQSVQQYKMSLTGYIRQQQLKTSSLLQKNTTE